MAALEREVSETKVVATDEEFDNEDALLRPQNLEELAKKLNLVFSGGRVNVEEVTSLMEDFHCEQRDWERFAYFDPYRYTRNLVSDGNGKYNLILLCWGEGHATGIHDHAGSHCFMKTVSGQVRETLFDWPSAVPQSSAAALKDQATFAYSARATASNAPGHHSRLVVRDTHDLPEEKVAYIHDKIGLHRVENPSHTKRAVSLHLYCPPYSECDNFDQTTGRANRCQMTFWSKFGQPTPFAKKNTTEVFNESH